MFDAGAEGEPRISQGSLNLHCGCVRATEHAPRGPSHFLECRHALAEIVERGAGVPEERTRVWSIWQVLLQYLDLHLTHRGALWASGAAQAAQFVRIILRWRGLCGSLLRSPGKTRFDLERGRAVEDTVSDAY